MDQHTCRLQTSHPIHITRSYATLLLSSTSAILLISPTKKPHITGFQQCTEMCDTHEGSSRTQWELQNSARSQTESTTVCYCLQKWPEQQPGGECKGKSLVERSMRAAGPQVRRFNKRFHPCWPTMRKDFLLLLLCTKDNHWKVNRSGVQQRAGWSKGWNKCNQRRWEVRGM